MILGVADEAVGVVCCAVAATARDANSRGFMSACDVSLEKNEGGGGEKEECLLLITKMRLDLTRTCIHSDYPAGCPPSKKTLFVSFPLCT